MNTKRFIALFAATLLVIGNLFAQTATNAPVDPNNKDLLDDLGGVGRTVVGQITALNIKNSITVEPVALYHHGDFGGGVVLATANTNGLNLGLALIAVDESDKSGKKSWQFYDGTLNISYTRSFEVPLIKWRLDGSLAAGPAFNLRNPDTVYDQETLTFSKTWQLGVQKDWALKVGGGVGHCSRWDDAFYVGFVGVTKRF